MSSKPSAAEPKRGLRAILVCGGVLLLSLGLSACPGSLDTNDFPSAGATGSSGGCGDVPTGLLKTRCATAGCHNTTSAQGSLDLTANAGLTMRLVGVDSMSNMLPSHVTPACSGKLIDKTAPDQSLLYTKCSTSPPCGASMPNVGNALTEAEKKCLLDWITSVAK